MSFSVAMKEAWRNKSLLLLTIAASSFIGLFFAFGTLLSPILSPYNQSPFNIVVLGLINIGTSFLGSILSGMILDRTAAYKRLILILMISTLIFLSLEIFSIATFASDPILWFFMFGVGLSMFSVLPAALGLGVELTFPLQPALVNGMMLLFTQISGFI